MAFGVHLSAPNLADTAPQAMQGAGFVPDPASSVAQTLDLSVIAQPFNGDSISVNNLTSSTARLRIIPPVGVTLNGNDVVLIPSGGVWSQAFDNVNPIQQVVVDYVTVPVAVGPFDPSTLAPVNPTAGGFVNVIVIER